jgi:multidrug resistance protein, MATE family
MLASAIHTLLMFSLPISMSLLINVIPSFVAIFLAAKLGKAELAAGAIAIPSYTCVMMTVSTLFQAVGILISHARGQNQTPVFIGHIVKNGFWLAIALGIITSYLLWHIDTLLIIFKQDPTVIEHTYDYFYFAGFAILSTLIFTVISQFLIGIGHTRFTLFISLGMVPLYSLLTYGLVLGRFGLPQLTLGGITCASFIVQTLFCLGLLVYLFCNKGTRIYKLFSGSVLPNFSLCKRIVSLGYPIGLQSGGELAAMTVAGYLTGYFGVIPLAASQIVAQYSTLVVVITLGLSQGLANLVGKAYGETNVAVIKDTLNAAILLLILLFVVIFVLFLAFPHTLIHVFLLSHERDNSSIAHLAMSFLTISAFLLLADGMRNLLSAGLRGLQDSKTPMRIGLYCLWLISLPVSYVTAFYCGGGPIGLRIGFMSGFVIAALLLWKKVQVKLNSI